VTSIQEGKKRTTSAFKFQNSFVEKKHTFMWECYVHGKKRDEIRKKKSEDIERQGWNPSLA